MYVFKITNLSTNELIFEGEGQKSVIFDFQTMDQPILITANPDLTFSVFSVGNNVNTDNFSEDAEDVTLLTESTSSSERLTLTQADGSQTDYEFTVEGKPMSRTRERLLSRMQSEAASQRSSARMSTGSRRLPSGMSARSSRPSSSSIRVASSLGDQLRADVEERIEEIEDTIEDRIEDAEEQIEQAVSQRVKSAVSNRLSSGTSSKLASLRASAANEMGETAVSRRFSAVSQRVRENVRERVIENVRNEIREKIDNLFIIFNELSEEEWMVVQDKVIPILENFRRQEKELISGFVQDVKGALFEQRKSNRSLAKSNNLSQRRSLASPQKSKRSSSMDEVIVPTRQASRIRVSTQPRSRSVSPSRPMTVIEEEEEEDQIEE